MALSPIYIEILVIQHLTNSFQQAYDCNRQTKEAVVIVLELA